MKKILNIMSASLILALTISACGGSSGSSSTSGAIDSPDSTYTGNRNPVLLKPGNTVHFARTLLGFETLFLFKSADADSSTINEPTRSWGLLAFSNLLNQIATNSQQSTGYQQRTETKWCSHSGTIEVTGESVYREGTGAQAYSFKNCQHRFEGEVLNGMMHIIQEKILNPESIIEKKRVKFSGLEVSMNGKRYAYTGRQDFKKAYLDQPPFSSHILSLTASMNITERDLNSNKTNKLEDVEITYSRSGTDQIKGRIYEHDLGYISLSGTNDLDLSTYFNTTTDSSHVLLSQIPIEGSLILNGASHSKAKVELIKATQDAATTRITIYYLINLDQDGDGIFEVRSIQSDLAIHNGDSGEYVEQYQPVARISWDGNDDDIVSGAVIKLSGGESSDPDTAHFRSLKYFWTLESKPGGSGAALSAIINEETTFVPDVYGTYIVTLKVIDDDGNTALATKQFDLSDKPPRVKFHSSQIENAQLELGKQLVLSVRVSDIEDPQGASEQYAFEWGLQKPLGSQSVLQYADRSRVVLEADKRGDYAVSYKTTDSQGNTTTESLSFTVINSPPVAAIVNHHDHFDIVVNRPRALHSASENPGTSGSDLMHHWELITRPVGSQARLTNENAYLNVMFTPDLIGQYRVRLTVTDPFGQSDSIEKDYTVVAD